MSRPAIVVRLLLSAGTGWTDSVFPETVQVVSVPSEALKASRRTAVLLPSGYAHSRTRYPVLYVLHGFTGNHEDWLTKTNLAEYAAPHPLIIVMPDGENSWYTNSATRAEYRYEDFIVKDLIAYVDAHYRSIASRHGRAIAGLSMGGFGAMKLGLKFPQLFSAVASFSGALAHAQPGVQSTNQAVMKSIAETFGPANHEAHAANDPFTIARKLGSLRPAIYFDCGNSDELLDANRKFAELLRSLKIPYEYREPPGGHTWDYWDRQIPEYLRWLAREWRLPAPPRMPVPLMPAPPGAAPPPPR